MAHSRRRKKPEESGNDAPAWITTFTDIMSLLCTFFILILTFSTMEDQQFQKAKGSLQGALGVMGQEDQQNLPSMREEMERAKQDDANLKTRFKKFPERELKNMEFLQKEDDSGLVLDKELIKNGVRLRLRGDALFDPASAAIRVDSKKFLSGVGNILAEGDVTVVVEGHTDGNFQPSMSFPTSLDLSGARAAAVAKIFLEEGLSPDDLKIAALGHYAPAFSNDDPFNRALNRRVDILLFGKGEKKDG